MQTIELDCPTCGEHLELDAGFAGGVCRCSSCGTLMTVPRDAGRAEQLTAPQRGAEMSDAAIDPAELQEIAAPRPSPRSAGKQRGKRGRSKQGAAQGATSTIDAGEYRTPSGKVVRVEQPMRVPMAQGKRKQIRMITTIVFVSVILSVVVIAAAAIWFMVSDSSGGNNQAGANGSENQPPAPPTYDASANPYTLKFPNLAGIPVQGKVAIVTEASQGDSEFWMPRASVLIRDGLNQNADASTQVALYAAQKGKPDAFAQGSTTPLTKLDDGELRKWFDGLAYSKPIDRTAAIEQALQSKPDVLVLVFSGATSKELAAWQELLKSKKDLTVHGVIIDSSSPLTVLGWLRGLESGQAISLSTNQLKEWEQEVAAEGK